MRTLLYISILGLFAFFSCDENDIKTHQKRLEEERATRLNYIKEHNVPDSAKKDEGIYLIELEAGTGETPKSGDWVLLYYTAYQLGGYIFQNNVLAGKYEPLIVELVYNNNSTQGVIIINAKRSTRTIVAGFSNALKYMRKGGRARVIVPSVLAYGIRGTTGVLPYTTLIYEIEVVEIRRN